MRRRAANDFNSNEKGNPMKRSMNMIVACIVVFCVSRPVMAQQRAEKTIAENTRELTVDSMLEMDTGEMEILPSAEEKFVAELGREPFGGGKGFKDPSTAGVDIELMSNFINFVLDVSSVGYSYSIYRNGAEVASGAGGNAQLSIDGSSIGYTTATRQEVASLSKTISAIAVLNALEGRGMDPAELVANHLPFYWNVPASVSDLTVDELLSHHSGLVNVGAHPTESLYQNLRASVENGRDPTLWGPNGAYDYEYDYENVNYGLSRYVLAYLVAPESMAYFDVMYITNWSKPWMQAYYAQVQEDIVRQIYLNYVRGTIFVPSGVSPNIHVFDWDASSQDVRYYNFQDTSIEGYSNDNNYDTMGPRGFVMRSSEVCRVMSKLEQAEIVSPTVRGWIKTLRLGVLRNISGGEVFYYKTGGNEDTLGRGRENILVLCPNNIQVVFHTNSRNNGYTSRLDVVTAAYQIAVED